MESTPTQAVVLAPRTPLTYGVATDPETSRLFARGRVYLSCDIENSFGATDRFWKILLPQIASSDLGTHSACVALGAAVSHDSAHDSQSTANLHLYYGLAIRKIQQDLTEMTADPACLASMCLLVGMIDLLIGRPVQALSHLQGALTLIRDRRRATTGSGDGHPRIVEASDEFSPLDVIDIVGTTLDICGMAFALDVAPRLPTVKHVEATPGNDLQITFSSEIDILKVLHACFTFLNEASRYKYAPARFQPSSIGIEQARHIAKMFATLRRLDLTLSESSDQQKMRSIVLRAQCSSCLIWLYAILDPRECVYDTYTPIFRSILDDAKQLVGHKPLSAHKKSPVLSTDLGIVQPLWLTATKSRDVKTRLEAIGLLRKSGRDAPFEGRVLALVARRAAELEAPPLSSTVDRKGSLSDLIPEYRRIVDCGPDTEQHDPADGSGIVAFFKRCVNVKDLMTGESIDEHKKDAHWKTWKEKIKCES